MDHATESRSVFAFSTPNSSKKRTQFLKLDIFEKKKNAMIGTPNSSKEFGTPNLTEKDELSS
jgi:hypothetical protein